MQRPLKLPTSPARVRSENKSRWNEGRSVGEADFFTVGYEGRTLADLIDALKAAEVSTLLDIRYTPLSMYRPELSKSNFSRHIEAAGLQYVHIPTWGVPKHVRVNAANKGSRDPIWDWYDATVVEQFFSKNLHWFLNLDHPVAMMCVEADPTECHRHRISQALERHGLCGFDL